jgi:hypothetical protein
VKPARLLPWLDWAARDLQRHPAETLLLGLALALLVAITGIGALLPRAMADAAGRLLAEGPALVVRRTGPAGWQPLPAREALVAAAQVPGALRARIRIWGLASAGGRSVTVVGVEQPLPLAGGGRWLPAPGQAAAGPGAASPGSGPLVVSATASRTLELRGTFDPRGDLAGFDILALHPDDARHVLGLAPETATDLALDVFHAGEAQALAPELAAAFPWPVSITRRSEEQGRYAVAASRWGGVAALGAAPALLALALLVSLGVRQGLARRREAGLLKALGWSGAQVVHLHLLRSALLALPATLAGAAGAYGLIQHPGLCRSLAALLGWPGPCPAPYLDPLGALGELLAVAVLALVPFLSAALFPALEAAAADPQDLLERGAGR